MSGLAEYTHETYGTARATIDLPAGRVEITHVTNPDEFATDREITQDEYDQIRGVLGAWRQLLDSALMASNPRGLVRR